MCLVSGVGGGLSDGVDESDTLKPLVVGKLNLTDEVMEMANHVAKNVSRPLWNIGANSINDSIGEVGVKTVGASLLILRRCLCVWVHLENMEG